MINTSRALREALAVLTAGLLLAACGPRTTTTPPPGIFDEPTLTSSPATPTSGPATGQPGDPGEQPDPACTNDSEFIDDVTLPDETRIPVGQPVIKTWLLRNSGTCAWHSGYLLRPISDGSPLETGQPVVLPPVEPGEEVQVSVTLRMSAGTPLGQRHQITFRVHDPEGSPFGATPYAILISAPADSAVDSGTRRPVPEMPDTPGAAIGGVVWLDHCTLLNGQPTGGCVSDEAGGFRANGVEEAVEARLTGIAVTLSTGECPGVEPVTSLNTNRSGVYVFGGLQAGTYCIAIDAANGQNAGSLIPGVWTAPPGASGSAAASITVGENEGRLDVSFGWDFQFD
jgi:hypothetical protein